MLSRLLQSAGFSGLLLLTFTTCSFGQGERASLTGTITDQSKAALPDTSVVLRNAATNVSTRTTTNSAGLYFITSIVPGTYELTVEKKGFRAAKVENIPLTTGLAATQDVVLEIGAVQQAVEVNATAVQIESQSSDLNTVVTTRPVAELPILGRDPLSFAALAPGVIPTQGQQGNAGVIGRVTTAQIGGGLAQQNGVLIDGAESRGTTESGNAYSVPVEAVAEFKLETASFNAVYGRVAGGVAILSTKSGTDTLHGTAYEYLRNNHLNANSWQNNRNSIPIALFQRNVFGGNLGGPVVIPKFYHGKDKTFFFFNYEGTRQASPDQILDTVPTAAQRAGDFSQTFDRNGNLDVIYDPASTHVDPASGKVVRNPFPSNMIPANRINNISANIVKFYPLPNRQGQTAQGVQNYLATGKAITNANNYLARIDHNFSEKERIFGRVGYVPYTNFSSIDNLAFGERSINSNPATTALIGFTSSFTPNLLGEFRISYTRLQFNTFPVSQNFDLASVGFGGNFLSNVTYKQFPAINVQTYNSGSGLSVTQASPNDFGALGGPTRTLNPQDTWQLQYQLNWIKGRQSIRFGTDLQLIRMNAYNSQYSAGQFNFDRAYTQGPDPNTTTLNGGNGLASLLLGIPVAGTITITNPLFLYQKYYSLFVQDDYRITNKLTLNLGLRWEYQTPYAEKFGQIGYFDWDGVEPATGRKGVFKSIKPGGYQENPQYWNFSPRLGLAWTPMDKTVVRAGAGIFFTTFVGVNAAATDFGNGGFISNLLFLGPANPLGSNTPPVGGSWNNPFAGGISVPTAGTAFVGQAVRADQLNRPKPYLSDWTLSIQRQVTPTLVAEVGYVGSKFTHLYWNRQHNQNDPAQESYGSQLLQPVANPFYGQIPTGALSTPTIQLRQLLRPYPQYQDVLIFRDPYGDMEYESMIARVVKQYNHGLLFQLAYTLSKTIANTAQSNTWVVGPSNALYDAKYNRGLEANDVPQRLVLAYIYDFPVGHGQKFLNHGVLATVLGGWEFSGISVFQSGRPILITGPDNTSLYNFSATNGRANRLKSGVLSSGQSTSRWFDTTAFTTTAPFTIGTDSLSQPDLRGPRRINTDFSLIKNTRFGKESRYNVQFRAELYNIFNHPALAAPITDVTNPQFGQITSSIGGSERNVQFGLRFLF